MKPSLGSFAFNFRGNEALAISGGIEINRPRKRTNQRTAKPSGTRPKSEFQNNVGPNPKNVGRNTMPPRRRQGSPRWQAG